MASFWAALQSTDLAVWINLSRWAYAGVATVHVLAIGVLIGSILTLDLRLIGFARWIDLEPLARLVMPVAGTALCCAIVSGALLFIGRAGEYAAFGTFQIKIALIACTIMMTVAVHRRYGCPPPAGGCASAFAYRNGIHVALALHCRFGPHDRIRARITNTCRPE